MSSFFVSALSTPSNKSNHPCSFKENRIFRYYEKPSPFEVRDSPDASIRELEAGFAVSYLTTLY
jgi:hypothetical protein